MVQCVHNFILLSHRNSLEIAFTRYRHVLMGNAYFSYLTSIKCPTFM